MPATNAHASALLAYEFNGTDPSLPASFYLSLHTAYPGRTGTQETSEATYTPYTRQAALRTSAGFTVSGSVVTLTAAATFPKSTAGATETAWFVGIGDAASGAGTLRRICAIGTALGPFAAEATGDTLTIPGLSGLAVDDRVMVTAAPGSALPGGLAEGTLYWVKTLTGDAVTLSTTQGGATLDITSAGDGAIFRLSPLTIAVNSQPIIEAGSQLLTVA